MDGARTAEVRQGSIRQVLSIIILTLAGLGLGILLTSVLKINEAIVLALMLVVVLLLYNPLQTIIEKVAGREISDRSTELEELADALAQELTAVVDLDHLATTVLKYATTATGDPGSLFYVHEAAEGGYRNYQDGDGRLLEESSPFVMALNSETGVIVFSGDTNTAAIETLREQARDALASNIALIAPMNYEDVLKGWLALPASERSAQFHPAEIHFFANLAEQASAGLERLEIIRRLESQIAELDLISQFSQYLNFTIVFDDMLELVYTNYRRLLSIEDFRVYWKDLGTQSIYTIFYVEEDERIREREGRSQVVDDPCVLAAVDTGQVSIVKDEHDRLRVAMPLNSGADTIGALYTYFRQPGRTLTEQQERLISTFGDRTAVAMDRMQTRQQVETRARQLEIINQVTFSLASTLELDPLLNLILDKAIELLNTEAGTFMLMDEDTGELEFRVVRGPTSQELIGTRLPIGTGLAGTAAQTGRPVLVNRVQEDKRWFDQVDERTAFQSQSILTAPLLRQNTVLGVVQVINRKDGTPFNEDDQMLLMAFAGQAVVALENARLLEQTDKALQERVHELAMLQQLDRDLNTTLDLDNVLNLTLDWILRICNGTAGAVALADNDGQLHLEAVRGQDEGFTLDSVTHEALKADLIGRVFSTGEHYVAANVHEEPDYLAISGNIHSQMSLPIVQKQKLIGVITIGSEHFDAFDDSAAETALRVTNHAAVAIANALLYEQVNEANLAKSEFVSMVSHELKTPMTSMRGYTELMLSGMTGDLTDQQKGFLETISSNIHRMGKQIQDLTDISRIETGRLRMETAPIPFTNIVSETLQSVQGPCDAKEIELHLDLPGDLPPIMADKERMVQVLTNLLSNACKYSPAGTEVFVTLKAEKMSLKEGRPPEPMVVCSVADQGYGISAENQKKLFTKFFRADDPNIRKAAGTGLGLSITRGIIEFHGGKIWVESELGKGTTFHFAIPQAQY